MDALSQILDKVDGLIWGAPLLIALMAVGIMLTAKLRLIQVSNLILSLKLVFSSKANADDSSHVHSYMYSSCQYHRHR